METRYPVMANGVEHNSVTMAELIGSGHSDSLIRNIERRGYARASTTGVFMRRINNYREAQGIDQHAHVVNHASWCAVRTDRFSTCTCAVKQYG